MRQKLLPWGARSKAVAEKHIEEGVEDSIVGAEITDKWGSQRHTAAPHAPFVACLRAPPRLPAPLQLHRCLLVRLSVPRITSSSRATLHIKAAIARSHLTGSLRLACPWLVLPAPYTACQLASCR